MYLLIFEDLTTRQSEDVTDEIVNEAADGYVYVFKVESGRFMELVGRDDWQPVKDGRAVK